MRWSVWPIIAILLYASGNVILDRKLRDVPPLSIVFIYGCALMVLSGGCGISARREIIIPSHTQWLFLLLVSVCWFLADNCYFRAYHSGVSMLFVTTCVACMPAVSSLLSMCFGGKAPTWRHWAAWVLILSALLLVAHGESAPLDASSAASRSRDTP